MNIPINYEWSKEEIVTVAEFFDRIAQVLEQGVPAGDLLTGYRAFKQIVPSKSEEKQLFKEVDEQLGASCYKIVKRAQETEGRTIIKQ